MNLSTVIVLSVAIALGSWVGVALVRRYALQRLLDLPNERSSHSQPTPRGGGVSVTVAHLLGLGVATHLDLLESAVTIALLGGGALVAVVGFLDDHGHVPASLRLVCHFIALSWVAWWFGGLPPVEFGWVAVDLGWTGTAMMVLYCVWFLNLFNFMDGIDGIAGAQALAMALTASLLLSLGAGTTGAALPFLLLAAATIGFLVWNWPPAKIFMGDVGSGYLGFSLGSLAIWTVVEGWLSVWVWLILGGAFLADATTALLVRARAGATLAKAHRSHAYQRLSRHWGSHLRVTVALLALNLVWLGPWAWLAAARPHWGAGCAAAALLPVFVLAARLGAGQAGEIESKGASA